MPNDPIRAVLDAYAAAVLAKDVDAFVALYDEGVVVFDMWGAWSCRGLDAWRAMASGWFGSLGDERVVVVFDEVQTTIAEDVAVLHAFARYTAIDARGGELRSLDNRVTMALVRRAGEWKVVHEHTSAPIAHETAEAILRR